MPKEFSFPRKIRLRDYPSIKKIFVTKQKKVFYPLIFRYFSNDTLRVVISISKKWGNAVSRNRIKRIVREVLRVSDFKNLKIVCSISIIVNEKTKNKKIEAVVIKNAISKFIQYQKASL